MSHNFMFGHAEIKYGNNTAAYSLYKLSVLGTNLSGMSVAELIPSLRTQTWPVVVV